MAIIANVGQKLKGKAQQVKGSLQVASGQQIKGNISKLRGKANELSADLKMEADKAIK